MVKIGILELVGYKEWTEQLGSDREWLIQLIQSNMYRILQEKISEVNGFVLSLRYDYMILVLEGVDNSDVLNIIGSLEKISPVPLRLSIACGKTPYEAQCNASIKLRSSSDKYILEECNPTGIMAAHFDMNDFTRLTSKLSVYDTFIGVEELYLYLTKEIQRIGGITQYLGGDNIVAFLSLDTLDAVKTLVEKTKGVKVGIGIARNARKSLMYAALALDKIRKSMKDKVNMLVLGDLK